MTAGCSATHRGIVHFTVGQRRGIEIGGQREPLYVVRVEPDERRIVVGPRRALAVQSMRVADWNWIGEEQTRRHREGPFARAAVTATRERRLGPLRTRPNMAWRQGRRRLLYEGTRLLGGGWIAETRSATFRSPMPPPRSAGVLLFRQSGTRDEVLLIKPGGPFWRNARRAPG